MALPVAVALLAVIAACFTRFRAKEQALAAEMAGLAERVRELQVRVDAAEADVAHAVTQGEIAESLLLEKGIADEEEIAAVRRRFGDEDAPAATDPQDRGGGELH